MAMMIGYARTSTRDQKDGLKAQIEALEAAGCERVYSEHASAATAHRPEYEAVRAFLRPGDVLVATKPDRLARNISDLLALVDELEARGAALMVLSLGGQPVDTRNPTSKLILTILGSVAAWEREIMLERQREGMEVARREGRSIGRPRADAAAIARGRELVRGGLSPAAAARLAGVSRSTLRRYLCV